MHMKGTSTFTVPFQTELTMPTVGAETLEGLLYYIILLHNMDLY